MRQFIVRSIIAAAALQGLVAGAFAADTGSQKFIKEAIEGNLAEVQMGELAQQKGQSDGVRNFGKMLVTDHGAANQKATAAAGQLGVTPPTEPNKKQKAMHDKMSKMSGAAFDRQFAKEMVDDHKKDIREYEKASKMKDAAVADYAKDALPTLHKHLDTAQSLASNRTSSR
jgi:putative membrane protein